MAPSLATLFSVGLSLSAVLPLGHASATAKCEYPPLINATADELQAGLSGGCFTSLDLVNTYVARIQEVNDTLHMVTQLNPDAWQIAMQLDIERMTGKVRGPLHGLPILIKANLGTKDKLETTAGSYALVGAKVPADSTVAAKLREAGMVILGKTDLSQWANFRSYNSSNGWSAYGGQTYDAYFPMQDPSGSSSGSGVASDLGLAFAAIGTETSGSIVSPSEFNNLVGIKPSVGLTSRYLVVPISERQDTVGPMARTVKDAAKVLQAIAGKDSNDNYTMAIPFNESLPDYVGACKLDGLQGKRIGVARNVIDLSATNDSAPIIAAFNNAIKIIASAGATIVEDANFTAYATYANSSIPESILQADFVSDIAKYFSELETNPTNIHDLAQLRNFTQHFPLEDYPNRDTGIWDAALAAGINNTSPEFWPMYQKNLYFGGKGGILGALKRHNLDAVILPTGMAYPVSALVGAPLITVPLGAYPKGTQVEWNSRGDLVEQGPGTPFGISFMGAKWSEESLIEMAYAFEQRTLVRGTLSHYIQPRTELKDVVI
ncbi:hypothetical protein DTO166G4_5850 [Paecilomyces variotii]|nr:hypothetical protein DTO032I3_7542 [Paecilomyces variotii]KAJ9212489.1 hypothetical protein DTO166G4_5850 [Paecilomyces variotii]KAJ9237012.1 hypothetical protein DTO166G5_3697 [Paecilomyces variotii]KAJ9238775.1 hypothetical protein DTO169E5_4608 [Paecilomyces variotii]KAJ9253519.1 hypothetical protein DTO195F2_7075 [Paecilomyces variotii]